MSFAAKAPVSAEKVRGGYYTPEPIARFLAGWVAEAGPKVLEPSCGDGNILRQLAPLAAQVLGVELVAEEAEKSRTFAPVVNSSLFEWLTPADYDTWDGVAGNPPYIRFGNWDAEQREPALALMSAVGMKPSKLTNAWLPFVVASALAVREGGRVGLVLPAEILQVNYASQLREYLLSAFSEITLVTFERLLFQGVLQEVVLLLAVKGPGPSRIRTVHLEDAASLDGVSLDVPTAPALLHEHEKWTKYFLGSDQIEVLRQLKCSPDLTQLGRLGSVDVGIVTGRNSFFTLTDKQVRALGLGQHVVPLVSRGRQLSSLIYDATSREQDLASENRTWILDAPADLSGDPALAAYVTAGENDGVHTGYKCRIRNPWWKTPSMWVPDAFLLRQIHLAPRMTVNAAGATTTDTVHRVRVLQGVDAAALAVAFHNSATFAFTEVMGRSYGGGILELEPREAELLPMPHPSLVTPALIQEVDALVRLGDIEAALRLVDAQVLVEGLGWSPSLVATCRDAWVSLRDRRLRRS
nr:class I SAM-dependent methyltransferase [Propionibacterium sp.]